jgi:kumamolisin
MRSVRQYPRGSTRRLALLVAVAVLIAIPAFAFSIADPGTPPGSSTVAPSPNGVTVAPAYLPGPGVTDLGPLAPTTPVEVAVGIAGSDPTEAASTLALIDVPGSPDYRHYLSPARAADELGATPAEYETAVRQFESAGLTVQTSPDRSMLLVRGPANRVGAAFGTTFDSYRTGARTFFSHPTPATLPNGVPWSGALGLGNVTPFVPAVTGPGPLATPSATCSTSGGNGFTPCQIEKGYNFSGLLAGGSNGTGFTVAVVDTYDGTEPQTQLESDLASFESITGTPAGTVDYLYPVPTTTNLNSTSTDWGFEEALDLEWARATAPGATTKMTFAPDATAGLYGSVDWLVAHGAANVISLSWGENDVGVYNAFAGACTSGCNATTDGSYDLLHPVLEAAALEGISVLSASGDCGAAAGTSGDSTDYPASDPYVVGVGGTDLTLTSADAWSSETAWGGNSTGATSPGCQNQGGSTGGYSPFPRPYWQTGSGISVNQTHRGEPDVAMIAGGAGVETVYSGFATAAEGTSVACPLWAGLVTDIDSYGGAALGFLDPSLYAAAAGASGSKAFHDITTGSNGYSATKGWDPVTGLGSPNGGVLAPLLTRTHVTASTINLTLGATPRFGPAPLTVNFTASATGGTHPYAFYDVDFGDYNSAVAPGGRVTHTYTTDGAYSAWAVVFDAGDNSTVSEPVEVVVGGRALSVVLNSSLTSPTVDQPVTFGANVSGGVGPYTYNWSFGDGTYLQNGTNASVTHSYGASGGYCVTVAAHDAASPQDGGGSNRILELVGTATTGFCANATAIVASLNVTPPARDLPGGFTLRPAITGGTPPYTVQYASNDPYVGLCECALFRTAGTHPITAFVNDSVDEEATTSANVTLYPALRGTYVANVTSGPAPLSVGFHADVSDGHGPNATVWTFGDGASSVNGTFANHTYSSPGFYVALADSSDGFGGNASEAFLVDVTTTGSGPVVTATISPAVHVLVGTLVTFSASVLGAGGPYSVNWSFSTGLGGFGNDLSETFPYSACLVAGTCRLDANLTVENASGGVVDEVPIALPHAEAGNATGLDFAASLGPSTGDAPFTVFGAASATGVPGVTLAWTFGDGGSAAGGHVSHTYVANGEYTVTVTATDAGGDLLVRTFAVVGSGPGPKTVVAYGGPNVSAGVAPLRVNFTATAQGGAGPPYNFTWTFGDNTTGGYGAATNHTYLHPGDYVAFLTARDPNGATGTAAFPVSVYNGTDTGLTLSVVPNVTRPDAPITLVVATSPICTPTSAPGCSAGNVTLRATFALAGALPTPVAVGGSTSFVVPVNAGGQGSLRLDAPASPGTYAVSVATTTRNYTGLAIAYLVVNETAAPAPPDYSVDLLVGATGVGVVVAAVVALGTRRGRTRPGESPPESVEPPRNP